MTCRLRLTEASESPADHAGWGAQASKGTENDGQHGHHGHLDYQLGDHHGVSLPCFFQNHMDHRKEKHILIPSL